MQKGTKKNKKIESPIQILTQYGAIVILRNMDYCPWCGKLFGQIDNRLRLDEEHKITAGMKELCVYVSQAIGGYEVASEMLYKMRNLKVSATHLQMFTNEVGKVVYDRGKETAQAAYQHPEKVAPFELEKDKKDDILYIITDGSCINTRIQDENGSTWKEMKLGMTFLDSDIIHRKNESAIITKKEYVCHLGKVEQFKQFLFNSAVKAGYGKVKRVVFIGDGAHWIWNICKELFPDAECILDYYHMTENVYKYAKQHYTTESKTAAWAENIIRLIKNGEYNKSIYYINETEKNIISKDNYFDLKNYFENNKERMKYPEFKEKGYYIGSGMIEGGNKIVIQKRMKQCGMRWSINGAQYMASLRAKYQSRQWEDVVDVIFNQKAA